MENKVHWENVYTTKKPDQVSWTQAVPQTSLDLINSFGLDKSARIIDVGGGDSRLVDFLLEQGYNNLTVLDISSAALEKAKERLGTKASEVNWVVADILDYKPTTDFDIWHDRAAFHFLTKTEHIEAYMSILNEAVQGFVILGTFSEMGPKKCSGLDIRQYTEETMAAQMPAEFERLSCRNEDHKTPFDTIQNFIFCSFKRKKT